MGPQLSSFMIDDLISALICVAKHLRPHFHRYRRGRARRCPVHKKWRATSAMQSDADRRATDRKGMINEGQI